MNGFIYFVGKPYPLPEAIASCRQLGYKIGLFLDKNAKLPLDPETYDHIVEVNFSSAQTMIQSLAGIPLQVSGLICTYENYIVAKSRLAEYFKVSAPDVISAQITTDKYLMRKAFLKSDATITPNFALISSEKELISATNGLNYPLMLKPTNLVKSLLVLKCNSKKELLENYDYAKNKIGELYEKYKIYDRDPQLIVEEYISGKSCSIAAFVDSEGTPHFCDGIVALTSAQEHGVDDNYIYARYLPANIDKALEKKLFKTAEKGIRAIGLKSAPAHVELIFNESEVKLIEIGARIGGYRPRMYDASYGIDMIMQEIKLALGKKPDVSGTFRAYSGVFELFPEIEGLFDTIEGASDTEQYAYYSVKAKPGQKIGPAKRGYKASVVIIVNAKDKKSYDRLQASLDIITIRTKR